MTPPLDKADTVAALQSLLRHPAWTHIILPAIRDKLHTLETEVCTNPRLEIGEIRFAQGQHAALFWLQTYPETVVSHLQKNVAP
jgi:hypothetical protein